MGDFFAKGKRPISGYGGAQVVKVSYPVFSSLPQTLSNAKITSDMECTASVLSNPSAQTGDWTVTTSNGSVTVSGSISGSTTLTLYLEHITV